MAEKVGEIYYNVDLVTKDIVENTNVADKQLDKLQKGFDDTDKSARSLNGNLSKLAVSIGAVITAGALKDMANMVQRYQEMSERVQMATSSQAEFEMVQKRLLATANGTYRSMGEAQELYIRTADSLRALGYNTSQALDVTDSMSYAFVKNATNAEKANNAIAAVSKSWNKGKVEAEAWETIVAAIPSVINDLADSMGKTGAEVRALGAAGDLTGKQLAEGLRKSLDANAAAAAGMSNNLTDASVRLKTALTTVLVSLEGQTGALQTFTNGLISASQLMIDFGSDGEAMNAVLTSLTLAINGTAAVLGAKLLMSLAGSTKALYASTVAAGAKARADVAAAQAATVLAAEELILARAAAQATVGLSTHAAAATRLAAAEAAATTATGALASAQTALAGVATLTSRAMAGLRTTMAFLGGPLGVIMLAAAAIYTFTSAATEAKPPVDLLTGSIEKLSKAQLELQRVKTVDAMTALQSNAAETAKNIAVLERNLKILGSTQGKVMTAAALQEKSAFERRLIEQRSELDTTNQSIADYQKRLNEIDNAKPIQLPTTGAGASGEPAASKTSADGQKALDAMREELELAKLTGEARARLQAIQKLGNEATAEEKEEAEKLATQIYRLTEARKELKEATKQDTAETEKSAAAKEKDTQYIVELAEKVNRAKMSLKELAAYNATLALSKYATPEQVAEVERLNKQLQLAEELQRKRAAFGDETAAAEKIKGDVDPLSGGEFDNQYARYAAEEQAEIERYQKQQDRLREAKELEIQVLGGYQKLEEQMYMEHNARLQQIDQAKTKMMLSGGEQLFGGLADAVGSYVGESSSAYKTLFSISKAFSIAQSIMAIQTGIAQAAANPWPANLAAMASVASATAGLVSSISSVTMGGGRLYGGPVQAGNMHRINENGQPEVFQAANGRQYMLPNTRGEVISNGNASGGGGGITNVVTINIDGSGAATTDGTGANSDAKSMADGIRVVVMDQLERESRQGGMLWRQRNG